MRVNGGPLSKLLPKLPRMKRNKGTRSSAIPSIKGYGRASIEPWGLSQQGGGWGGRAVGRWFEPNKAEADGTAAAGVCAKCGEAVKAIDLKPTRRKDGTDAWVCKECRQGGAK